MKRKTNDSAKAKQLGVQLMDAVAVGDYNEVKQLTEETAKISGIEDQKQAALYLAVELGHRSIIELLINCGAKVNEKDEKGFTALQLASENGHENVAGLLLAYDANVNEKDSYSPYAHTALHFAAANGHTKTIDLLIRNDADVNAQTQDGWTPLHAAVLYGNKSVIDLLIKNGADVNAKTKDDDSCTVLHIAAENSLNEAVSIVKLLLAHPDIDLSIKNNKDKTAAEVARDHGQDDIAELIEGAATNPLSPHEHHDGAAKEKVDGENSNTSSEEYLESEDESCGNWWSVEEDEFSGNRCSIASNSLFSSTPNSSDGTLGGEPVNGNEPPTQPPSIG